MIDREKKEAAFGKTPADVSSFEREQLKFFLSSGDIAATLSEINPSLAWLPVFWDMNLIQDQTQLTAWVERNFGDVQAIRDVVANIQFFGPEAANVLEYRLNTHAHDLPSLPTECWRLIIRHMRNSRQGLAGSEWFEIMPQVKRGDHSPALLERIAAILRPKLRIREHFAWRREAAESKPRQPSDLMSIEYKVDDNISSKDILDAWRTTTAPEVDEALIGQLTVALNAAMRDATDVGVEGNKGRSTSDIDVPSVAAHFQNEYRSGFQLIIRVIAEVWTRLVAKSPEVALAAARPWCDSPFRLVRRLAMFAFNHEALPADAAADLLIQIPAGDLFLTNASVEAYRLILTRWKEFTPEKQQHILRRICDGPPRDWFREGSSIDAYIDRSRFDLLSEMVRAGIDIGVDASDLLKDIGDRWPQWQPKPSERAGFHIWHESGTRKLDGTSGGLKDVADDDLVAVAERASVDGPEAENGWQNLCLSNPDRAFRGLELAAAKGQRPERLWRPLLWSNRAYSNADTEGRIAEQLLLWPVETFSTVAAAASVWLEAHASNLADDLVWPLWDRVADATLAGNIDA